MKAEFEDILKQVGDYGWFQRRLVYFFLIPITTIFSMLCMNTFFMLSEPDHWCTVPNTRIQNLTPYEQHILTRKPIPGTDKFEHCSYYETDYDVQVDRLDDFKRSFNTSVGFKPQVENSNFKECNSWTYDRSSYVSNAVIDLNLVCGKRHWKSLIQTIHGIGEVVGNPPVRLSCRRLWPTQHPVHRRIMHGALLFLSRAVHWSHRVCNLPLPEQRYFCHRVHSSLHLSDRADWSRSADSRDRNRSLLLDTGHLHFTGHRLPHT